MCAGIKLYTCLCLKSTIKLKKKTVKIFSSYLCQVKVPMNKQITDCSFYLFLFIYFTFPDSVYANVVVTLTPLNIFAVCWKTHQKNLAVNWLQTAKVFNELLSVIATDFNITGVLTFTLTMPIYRQRNYNYTLISLDHHLSAFNSMSSARPL